MVILGTWQIASPDDPTICDRSGKGTQCKVGQNCSEFWKGPNYGITSFDNIFAGCLTIFQVITNEGWTDIMYWVSKLVHENYFTLLLLSAILISRLLLLSHGSDLCSDFH